MSSSGAMTTASYHTCLLLYAVAKHASPSSLPGGAYCCLFNTAGHGAVHTKRFVPRFEPIRPRVLKLQTSDLWTTDANPRWFPYQFIKSCVRYYYYYCYYLFFFQEQASGCIAITESGDDCKYARDVYIPQSRRNSQNNYRNHARLTLRVLVCQPFFFPYECAHICAPPPRAGPSLQPAPALGTAATASTMPLHGQGVPHSTTVVVRKHRIFGPPIRLVPRYSDAWTSCTYTIYRGLVSIVIGAKCRLFVC